MLYILCGNVFIPHSAFRNPHFPIHHPISSLVAGCGGSPALMILSRHAAMS